MCFYLGNAFSNMENYTVRFIFYQVKVSTNLNEMDFICSTTCSILRPQLRQVMSDMKPDSQYQYKKQSICQVSARIFPSNTKLTVCSPLSSVSNFHHPPPPTPLYLPLPERR